MIVALFYSEDTNKTAHTIGSAIERLGVGVHYLDIGIGHTAVSDTSIHVVLPPDSTHVLFLYTADESVRRYYHFYSGFCLGRGLRFLVLDGAHDLDTSDPFIHLGTVLSAETLTDFMQTEKERFSQDEKVSRAKQQLLERGISCFPESFLSVVVSGDTEAARLFLDAGYSPSLRDTRGVPALSLAVRSQYPDMVHLLLDNGAQVNDVSADRGYSPLMDAAQKGDEFMCRLLLEHGADVNLASKDGQTALILCAGRGDDHIAAVLYDHGADPYITDKLGMSARGYAALFKNQKMLDLFNTPAS